jgi:ornithine carbamoyltransferase
MEGRFMSDTLRNRSLLSLNDLSVSEIGYLLRLSADLKAAKRAGIERPRLAGKTIALLFEMPSTRTRIGFEVAANDQGARVTYLDLAGAQLGSNESVEDTAHALGQVCDAIEYRGASQAVIEELARHAGVPVYNGLTTQFHPTQVLADLLTMQEHCDKPLSQARLCFVGDTSNNVARSLLVGAAKIGLEIRLCGPKALWPETESIWAAESDAKETGGRVQVTADIQDAVDRVDFLYTDAWLYPGEPEQNWADRMALLRAYQVNSQTMRSIGNPKARFMHCLPAFHDRKSAFGRRVMERFGLDAMEVTDEVFRSRASIVFEQVENRLHTIKAVLVATIGK